MADPAAAPENAESGASTEPRDYYTILGAEPSSTAAELRTAFRAAVLRYHPDRTPPDPLGTPRTSALNRAWAVLRDPLRRRQYDQDLEAGLAETGEWPLDPGETPRGERRARRARTGRGAASGPSPWHQPEWRNVAGFRVPAAVWFEGPAAHDRYIVEHYIAGEDWRGRRELYWLRYAARHYRARGLTDDWLGALERLVELDPSFETLASAGLRDAYIEARQNLRGAAFLHRVGARYERGSAAREWIDREIRGVLGPFRDREVRRGPAAHRAENAELLLNYLEALELEPTLADLRATVRAHVRAGNPARALALAERPARWTEVEHPRDWFAVVQLLTDAGQLDSASSLLASLARGDRPEVLDSSRLSGEQLLRRLAASRRRLESARGRAHRRRAD